jgi:hypothetical protein
MHLPSGLANYKYLKQEKHRIQGVGVEVHKSG